MNALIWQPYFPIWLISLATGAAGILTLWRTQRGWNAEPVRTSVLTLFRLGVITALTLCLLGPSRLPEPANKTEGRPLPITLMLDTSASMLTEDMDGITRFRFALQRWMNPAQMSRFNDVGVTRVSAFDTERRLTDLPQLHEQASEETVGNQTRLIHSLLQQVRSSPEGTHLLMLTDGHDSMDDSPATAISLARNKNITIHTVSLGGARLEKDIHLLAIANQPYLIAGESGSIRVRILQTNADGSSTLTMETGGEITDYPVNFGQQPFVDIEIPISHDVPGSYAYNFSVEPLAGELEKRNNHQVLFVDILPKRFRVLLIEGNPYWDTKFLAQTLRQDARLELMQVSQIAQGRQETLLTRLPKEDADFPTTQEALAKFDVIILGRHIEHVTGQAWLRLLPPYVEQQGGRIIFARERAYDLEAIPDRQLRADLRRLEPVDLQDDWLPQAQFLPAPAGRNHPGLKVAASTLASHERFQGLSPARNARRSRPGPATQIYARFHHGTESIPALAGQRVGSGQTLMVLGHDLWRWRLRNPEQDQAAIPVFETFWSNTVRWMLTAGNFLPGAEVSLDVTPRMVAAGQPVTAVLASRLPMGDRFPEKLTLYAPDGSSTTRQLTPDSTDARRAEIQWVPDQTGVYRAEVITPGQDPDKLVSRVNVYALDTERLRSNARPDLLRLLARETGGTFLDPWEPEQFAENLTRQARLTARQPPSQPIYIWNSGWWMTLILLLAGFEWILRKKWGWN